MYLLHFTNAESAVKTNRSIAFTLSVSLALRDSLSLCPVIQPRAVSLAFAAPSSGCLSRTAGATAAFSGAYDAIEEFFTNLVFAPYFRRDPEENDERTEMTDDRK